MNGTRLPSTNQITQTQMEGNTQYNSLQATLQQRLHHGLSFLFNYTWSHATDDLPVNTGVTSAGAGNSYVLPVYSRTTSVSTTAPRTSTTATNLPLLRLVDSHAE